VVAVLGWRWYEDDKRGALIASSDRYVEFLAAEGDARDALAEQIIGDGKGTAYPTFVLFQQADAAIEAGDAAAAEGLLRRAVELASGESLADAARLRLARVLFQLERADDALAELGTIRGLGYRALAAELQGDIQLSRGDRELAHESYTNAQSLVPAGEQRPLLEMKLADTADASDS
jgi:predicted negative regulator of RcsB-dependent stress response